MSSRSLELPRSGYLRVLGVQHHLDALRELFPEQPDHTEPHSFDVGGVQFTGRVISVERHETHVVPAELRRQPDNPYDSNAVAVLIRGRLVGYVPRELASAWADFLGRCEAAGYTARAQLEVGIDVDRFWLSSWSAMMRVARCRLAEGG